MREHAAEQGIAEREAWATVERYIHEIVPFFNVVAYYQIGYRVSGLAAEPVLQGDGRVRGAERRRERLPRDAVIVYLMNHRSNADYVLVSYALAGQVAISYAVGEWARAFPLEHVFKAFGSYFIRRRYREPLYHTVLERYVQLITREGVTQGIFLEGGLTRDGKLRPPKIGLLDYVLGIGARPGLRGAPARRPRGGELRPRARGPVAAARAGVEGGRAPAVAAGAGVRGGALRRVESRAPRHAPVEALRSRGGGRRRTDPARPVVRVAARSVHACERPERLARVQSLCDGLLTRVGALIPVTSVPLVCAAIQSFDGEFIARDALLERIDEMRDVLLELNAGVLRQDRECRGAVRSRVPDAAHATGDIAGPEAAIWCFPEAVPSSAITRTASDICSGPFAAAVRARDALPSMTGLRSFESTQTGAMLG